jgi:hypothetical protein
MNAGSITGQALRPTDRENNYTDRVHTNPPLRVIAKVVAAYFVPKRVIGGGEQVQLLYFPTYQSVLRCCRTVGLERASRSACGYCKKVRQLARAVECGGVAISAKRRMFNDIDRAAGAKLVCQIFRRGAKCLPSETRRNTPTLAFLLRGR